MDVEQLTIRAFLEKCPPLTDLPAEALDALSQAVEIRHIPHGTEMMSAGASNDHALLIRAGGVDVLLANGDWYGRFGEGDWVGYRSVLRGGKVSMTVRTIEDSVFYALPAAVFLELCKHYPRVQAYFTENKAERLRSALATWRQPHAGTRLESYARELMKFPLLLDDLAAATSPHKLAVLSQQLPKLLVTFSKQDFRARDISEAISSIGATITRRLLSMAEAQFGQPPVPYAFIVAGSMARREQTAHSDQDNGMILSDDYNAALHGEYFRKVAQFVSDGLNACGYVYCPGDVMATNPQWRQPWSVWHGYFSTWIDSPQPKALMYASIFFDLRCLHGDASLLERLQQEILRKTQVQTLFQAFMAGNALSHKPPLGFFRGFVLDKDSQDNSAEKGMDMKKRGVVPVIDMARLYALAGGIPAINTWERLEALGKTGMLTQAAVEDLRDAFEFISMTRLRHQAKQIENGHQPNNYVPPEELSALERRHLKDAFEVVSTLQESMATRYQADRFR